MPFITMSAEDWIKLGETLQVLIEHKKQWKAGSDLDRPGIRVIDGREMRGGLQGGHQHMAWVSAPVLKRRGVRGDCVACVEWAKELIDANSG